MNVLVLEDWESLSVYLKEQKKNGKIIVFTNGCFDIVHSGHVTYLREAKSLGDILVVALNDDESVKRLKEGGRPLFSLTDRIDVISELRSVDVVTSFPEDTPLQLIERIIPDILVKGGDYTRDTIVGADVVEEHGGRVEVVPYIHGKSTTAIIKKIKQL